ncbi:carboxymuconolactone decarboxylase family protein [Bacillus changyiensis]|uniref:carboxymuconolactone decarboxylase family protein n=1 Tax=Bacillus changyiensis TaxID=3004103 RepID=UPI0022E6D590|nr:carboxymuconolactone decarboxylase family protein [Bacillus changyiensis]MDA1477148.1 carboxymuconolactone decarboxylase family protein [Bacillus changyiensis]
MEFVSHSFQTFLNEAPEHAKVWGDAVGKLDQVCNLDQKTEKIAYLAVMAAVGLESGIPFHVKNAKASGVSRKEVISAILLGLPAVGNQVVKALPIALAAFDEEPS